MTKKAQTQRKQQEQQIVNRYSEMTEEQLKAAINEDDQEISVLETKQDQRLIAAGEKLIALKARTKHGQWLPTLKGLREGKGIPQKTANRWMTYAKDPQVLEDHRKKWREANQSELTNFTTSDEGQDSFEDDFKSFKEKVKQGQQGADHEPRQATPSTVARLTLDSSFPSTVTIGRPYRLRDTSWPVHFTSP